MAQSHEDTWVVVGGGGSGSFSPIMPLSRASTSTSLESAAARYGLAQNRDYYNQSAPHNSLNNYQPINASAESIESEDSENDALLPSTSSGKNNNNNDEEAAPQSLHKSIFKVVVSGVGFFSDAYDIFIINIVLVILKEKYKMETIYKTLISSAAVAGAVTGMLLFGWLGDKLGRKKGFIATLTLVVVGAIASAAAFATPVTPLFVSLAIFQFGLGIGIGGEYPLSATITAESSNASNRGRMLAAVFSMQGVGQLAAALVSYLLLYFLGEKYGVDLVWRLCVGVGALPGILMFYFRVSMPETPAFANKNQVKEKDIEWMPLLRAYGLRLFGTAMSWGLFDITFYANGLFAATVLSMFGVGEHDTMVNKLIDISQFNIYIALMALPGYFMAFLFIDRMGRKGMQVFGFLMIAGLYFSLGVLLQTVNLKDLRWVAIALYGATFFSSNFGPNSTTFILPSECFPTRIRARCHGISAATGKLGAVIGAAVMSPLLDIFGLHIVLYICGGIALTGCLVTVLFVVETSGKTLKDLEIKIEEDEDEERFYHDHGASRQQGHEAVPVPVHSAQIRKRTLSDASEKEWDWSSIGPPNPERDNYLGGGATSTIIT